MLTRSSDHLNALNMQIQDQNVADRVAFSEKDCSKVTFDLGKSVVHVGLCTSRAVHSSVALTALLTATDHSNTISPLE